MPSTQLLSGAILSEYQTKEEPISQVATIQDMYCYEQGYIFVASGKIYCIEMEGEDAGLYILSCNSPAL